MSSHILSILLIIILVILSAYFSATETAFTSLNKIKVKNKANNGDKSAKRVIKIMGKYDQLLTTILVGNNIVNIAMTAVATVLFINLYGAMGATISTVVMTIVVLIFGEISPKIMAKEVPEKYAAFSAPLIRVLMVILKPINFIFTKWKKLLVRILKISNDTTITGEEIRTLVEEAETGGGIETDQSILIQNAIEFNDLMAEDILTPRVDIEAIDFEMSNDEVAEIFLKSGFSRIPVYEDDLDKIIGVLNQKDFHNYVIGKGKSVRDMIKPVVFVGGTMKIAALLRRMQVMKTQIAIIVDEYGGTEGLVTMEDILEELVGEIFDEHDPIISQEIKQIQGDKYIVACNANLSKIFEYFEIEEEFDDVNTVNGWVMLELDKIPAYGDTFKKIYGKKEVTVKVIKAEKKRAVEIVMTVKEI
ncbi:MAG: hemolysin family protein [Eubacteriales bacterium]|nr:hemolysin family protein [Eubacteriales bacterium]MDY3332506.1 hemolysin family protein [Gallibacter sp.]